MTYPSAYPGDPQFKSFPASKTVPPSTVAGFVERATVSQSMSGLATQLKVALAQYERARADETIGPLVQEALHQERTVRDQVCAIEDRSRIPTYGLRIKFAKAEARAAALLDAWEAVVGEPYSVPLVKKEVST
jgi:hypothetical protein